MGRWAIAAVAVLLVVGVAAMPEQQAPAARVAFVSTELILRNTPGFAAAESTFNKEVQSFRTEVENLQKQLDSASRAFDQQSVMLSATARQEKQQELQRLSQQVYQRQQELNQKAQDRRDQLMAPLEDRVQRVIDGLRAERGLAIIFDVSAGNNQIISADPTLDLTQVVVGRLNSSGQGQ